MIRRLAKKSFFLNWVINLALILFGLLVGLAIVEGIARLTYRQPWHSKLIEEQRRSEIYSYQLNRYNLRDRDYLDPKRPDARRVLILGDSFTFGQGVYNDDAIFPEILERQLNASQAIPGVEHVEVLNAGISGSLTGNWLNLCHALFPQFDPDIVLIVFFLRDGTRTASIPEFFDVIRRKIEIRNRRSRLYRYCFTFRYWRDYWDRSNISSLYASRFHKSYFGNKGETSEWRRAQSNLLKIRDLTKQKSAVVGLVVFPIFVELNENYPFRNICDLIENFAVTNGIPSHNLLPEFLGKNAPDLWISGYDQHPNEKAHSMVAESLLPFVVNLLKEGEKEKKRQ
jgi:lysophospholipase L1-like esterase